MVPTYLPFLAVKFPICFPECAPLVSFTQKALSHLEILAWDPASVSQLPSIGSPRQCWRDGEGSQKSGLL